MNYNLFGRIISRIRPVQISHKLQNLKLLNALVFGSVGTAGYALYKYHINRSLWPSPPVVYAAKKTVDDELNEVKTLRQKRYESFASVEFEGELYMTPRDFLESVTQAVPQYRKYRRRLSKSDLDDMLRKTVPRRRGSKNLFRSMDHNEPESGFRIAFNMFDVDGDQRVDKQEFLVQKSKKEIEVVKVMKNEVADRLPTRFDRLKYWLRGRPATEQELEETFAKRRRTRDRRAKGVGEEAADTEEQALEEAAAVINDLHKIDTTVLVHLFGSKGTDMLKFDDFFRFYDNLQTEVLELEFNEFSRGQATITEMDFAKILLRYTIVHHDDYQAYLKRVEERIPASTGINFDEFREFCKFLNNLEDFTIAMKLYTFANLPVSQAEFARAVKLSTGHYLNKHVVNTVFQIFDVDGDGRLSHSEFVQVMHDRIHRGYKSQSVNKEGWAGFKQCLRNELHS